MGEGSDRAGFSDELLATRPAVELARALAESEITAVRLYAFVGTDADGAAKVRTGGTEAVSVPEFVQAAAAILESNEYALTQMLGQAGLGDRDDARSMVRELADRMHQSRAIDPTARFSAVFSERDGGDS